MRRFRSLIVLCAAATVLGACDNLTKRDIGTGVGAVLGVAVGSMFGSGSGRAVAMAVGGAAGGLAGAAIGAELDKGDRMRAYDAAFKAANSDDGGTVHWTSDSKRGVGGYAEPSGPAAVDDGKLCRNVRSVYVLEGQERTQVNRFCFQDGQWVAG